MKLRAKKSLGQNFLVNPAILDKIVTAAEINSNDVVLEIGPGTGNLTAKLAKKARAVIAVEKDRRLIEDLKEKFQNADIVEGDILKLDVSKLIENYKLKIKNFHYKIVGNIPYYITSHLLRTVFEKWPRSELIILTIQKEVAQRIMAKPPHMNLLALSVRLYSKPEIIGYVSKINFRPQPKVDSAIIRLSPNPKINEEEIKKIMVLAKKAFGGKRKQLKNTLPQVPFEKLGIVKESRPEELSLDEWISIASNML